VTIMMRVAVAFLGLAFAAGTAFGQVPTLISGNSGGLSYGQAPEGPTVGIKPTFAIGGLILNTVDPFGAAWLQVATPKGNFSVDEVFPATQPQQALTFGNGSFLFGGDVPKEWMISLQGTTESEATTNPSPTGSANPEGLPILTVRVNPPSSATTTVGEVSYDITTADGESLLFNYSVPLETGGWWILGLTPTDVVLSPVDPLPIDPLPIDDGAPLPDPLPDDRVLQAGAPPAVPEPGTLALAGLGLACVAVRLRRK